MASARITLIGHGTARHVAVLQAQLAATPSHWGKEEECQRDYRRK